MTKARQNRKKEKKKNKVCWLLNRFSTLQSFTLINKLDREIWADLYLFQYNLTTGPLKKKKKREGNAYSHNMKAAKLVTDFRELEVYIY